MERRDGDKRDENQGFSHYNLLEKDRRGLSTIIVTVILIGLSLAAIVIVWVVVSNLINQGAKNIDIGSKCLGVNVEATYANCTDNGNCTVTLERTGTGTDEIGGVKFILKNATTSSSVIDVSGNVPPLEGKTVIVANPLSVTNDVEVTAYFTDTAGKQSLCSNTNGFGF